MQSDRAVRVHLGGLGELIGDLYFGVAKNHARLPFAIAHKPGHMLVTDIPNTTLAVI